MNHFLTKTTVADALFAREFAMYFGARTFWWRRSGACLRSREVPWFSTLEKHARDTTGTAMA